MPPTPLESVPKPGHPDGLSPVIFGEVLYDVFPEGRAVLGGAPFNVAWNLQGLGLEPILISRVGDDSRGEQLLTAMRNWGMDAGCIQVDPDRPTGAVEVELQEGQPQFHILPDQAYDFIQFTDPAEACARLSERGGSLLYHGTLAARADVSRQALSVLREELDLPAFVDVNLRAPWWERGAALAALRGTRWAKLNAGELRSLMEGQLEGDYRLESAAKMLRQDCDLEYLVVTEGEEGAFVFRRNDQILDLQPAPVEKLVDTVGAGDAFSAVMILGMAKGWPDNLSLRRAAEFAGFVCTLCGATVEDRSLYDAFVSRWEGDD